VCGPETALVAGLGDAVRATGIDFFGPSAAAAEIEGSKAYGKALMARAGVPTAAFGAFDDLPAALAFIDAQPGDVVVKADGLAAGKGVVVASSKDEARIAARQMLEERRFGDASARVVIEERLRGREVSMMALCDGERLALLATSEDHKAVGDGDVGPNTGGMGTTSPSILVDDELARRCDDQRPHAAPFSTVGWLHELRQDWQNKRGRLTGASLRDADDITTREHRRYSGGLDRLYVRGLTNVHKKFLIQAAACNLALLMRSLYGAGKPKAAYDRAVATIFAILAVLAVDADSFMPWSADFHD